MNAIESANMNMATMEAMKKGANVLKTIHGKLYVHILTGLGLGADDGPQ